MNQNDKDKEVDHSKHLCDDSCKPKEEKEVPIYKDRTVMPHTRSAEDKGDC